MNPKDQFQPDRRHFLLRSTQALLALAASRFPSLPPALAKDIPAAIPTRPLGRTGHAVTTFALGGEGVLRTNGRMKEAVRVINQALDLGVNYCDTAPAYAQSQDYYGEALGKRRKNIFLAAKTHERGRDASLKLLDQSLKRLRTDHLDSWQLHDLRTPEDLDEIFGRGGAIEAVEKAKQQKLVRFAGITGHHDPRILLEAMDRYPFDTVLCAVNAADRHSLSFIDTVVPKALEKGMGVVAMKVLGHGDLLKKGGLESARDAISYVLSLPVSTALIGCSTPNEVSENAESAKTFQPLSLEAMNRLEQLTAGYARHVTGYKAAELLR